MDSRDWQLERLGPCSQHADGRGCERDTCGGPQHRTGHDVLPARLAPRCLTVFALQAWPSRRRVVNAAFDNQYGVVSNIGLTWL